MSTFAVVICLSVALLLVVTFLFHSFVVISYCYQSLILLFVFSCNFYTINFIILLSCHVSDVFTGFRRFPRISSSRSCAARERPGLDTAPPPSIPPPSAAMLHRAYSGTNSDAFLLGTDGTLQSDSRNNGAIMTKPGLRMTMPDKGQARGGGGHCGQRRRPPHDHRHDLAREHALAAGGHGTTRASPSPPWRRTQLIGGAVPAGRGGGDLPGHFLHHHGSS